MIGARSAAMGFNRLADQAIDARNPRTAGRELPRGALSRREVWLFVALSAVALVVAAAMLNPLCLLLSPVALLVVLGYSYTKRFTLLLAPRSRSRARDRARWAPGWPCAGQFALAPIVLALAVLCWVAGFDTIYSCQDVEFDRQAGLRSLPALLGTRRALIVARILHVAAVVFLAALYALVPLHPVYLVGRGRRRRPAGVRTFAGVGRRPLARGCRVLHRQRLDQHRLPGLHGARRLASGVGTTTGAQTGAAPLSRGAADGADAGVHEGKQPTAEHGGAATAAATCEGGFRGGREHPS